MYDELTGNLRAQATHFSVHDETSLLLLKAADAIEGLSHAVDQMTEWRKNQWIPVTERLPNCNGCYLVWRPHFFCGEIGMPSICYFDGSNTWHDSYGVDFTRTLHPEDVTHWMPLPEPPKDGES